MIKVHRRVTRHTLGAEQEYKDNFSEKKLFKEDGKLDTGVMILGDRLVLS